MDTATPLYYDLNPKLKWLVRVTVPISVLMFLISVVILLVKALDSSSDDASVRFLALVVIICSFILVFFIYMWYFRLDLDVSYWWFVFATALALVYQSCVCMFVAFQDYSGAPGVTTLAPPVTITPFTIHPKDSI